MRTLLDDIDGHLGDLEDEFRSHHLEADRRLLVRVATLVAGFLALALGAAIVSADGLVGDPLVQSIRALILVASLAAAVGLRRIRRPGTLDAIGAAWLAVVALCLVANTLIQPPRPAHPALLLFAFSILLLVPVPLLARAIPAALVIGVAGTDAVTILLAGDDAAGFALQNLIVLNIAGLLGLSESIRAQRARRNRFVLDRQALAAQARTRDLAHLIPVCAYCGEVRKDDGYWSDVSEFLIHRGIALVERSLCEDCRTARVGQIPSGAADAEPVAGGASS